MFDAMEQWKPKSRSPKLHIYKEETLSNRTPEADESFGKGFNLVLAVKEHAPRRIDEITERLSELDKERISLASEKDQMLKLLAAVNQ